jgi:CO/xanthine dehydrogenase Mo-binding subunit
MGLGYGIMENVQMEGGHILNPGFGGYLIPTPLDIPEMTTIVVEDPEPSGPYGAKGVGEPALIPTAPAICSAVAMATGCRFFETPLTPERVWAAMNKKHNTDVT